MAIDDYRTRGGTPYRVTPYSPFGGSSPQPVYPTYDVPEGGGGIGWKDFLGDAFGFLKDNWRDVVGAGADAAGAYLSYEAQQQALKQQREQFDKNYGLNVNNQAMSAANQLNRAPVWDKASYLAQNYTPPMPFKPRDFTQGLGQLRGQPTGGAAAQLAANAEASANYKQGMGGIDTSTLKWILGRLQAPGGGGGANTAPPTGEAFSLPGAKPPTGEPQGVSIIKPTHMGGTGTGDREMDTLVAAQTYPEYFFPDGLPEQPHGTLIRQEWDRVYPGKAPPTNVRDILAFWERYRKSYNARFGKGG